MVTITPSVMPKKEPKSYEVDHISAYRKYMHGQITLEKFNRIQVNRKPSYNRIAFEIVASARKRKGEFLSRLYSLL